MFVCQIKYNIWNPRHLSEFLYCLNQSWTVDNPTFDSVLIFFPAAPLRHVILFAYWFSASATQIYTVRFRIKDVHIHPDVYFPFLYYKITVKASSSLLDCEGSPHKTDYMQKFDIFRVCKVTHVRSYVCAVWKDLLSRDAHKRLHCQNM